MNVPQACKSNFHADWLLPGFLQATNEENSVVKEKHYGK